VKADQQTGAAIPVTIVTGFLGSGKTTLLNYLLGQPGFAHSAVLINEFGSVAIDHLLVRKISDEMVVLNNGCLCCSIRSDLVAAMRDLFLKRVKGEVPEFGRLVIETSGLADPAPILHSLMRDPLLAARYRLDGVVCTVDLVNGHATLDQHDQAVKQVAMADRLLLTKADLATGAAMALGQRLTRLNPRAPCFSIHQGCVDPDQILGCGLFKGGAGLPDIGNWLKDEALTDQDSPAVRVHGHGEDHRVTTFVTVFEKPVNWPALSQALDLLISLRGESLLRIKGVVNAQGMDTPLVIHGVQHVFHPPVSLPAWPDSDRRTRLVFITRDLGRDFVEGIVRITQTN